MTKIINLDQLQTKRDKVVILGGVEHVMATLTVKDYINQLKAQTEIEKLTANVEEDAQSADRIIELTIEALMKLFPTITKDQFESLNVDQLHAVRQLADAYTAEDAPEAEDVGESTGKA